MRKALFLLPPLLVGCAAGSPEPATASFDSQGNIIMVTVSDPEPARTIELVSPTGEVTKATSVTTDQAGEQSASGSPPVGGYGTGFSGSGIGAADWGSGFGGGHVGFGGRVTSSATILLEHPDDYRQNWRAYRIQIDLGDPPNSHTVTLDAPASKASTAAMVTGSVLTPNMGIILS